MRRFTKAAAIAVLGIAALPAQTPSKTASTTSTTGAGSNQEMNIRAYVQLLRSDLKKGKSQVMGEVMALDADQSAKFWPIYKEFETEYSGLGDQIVGLVKQYAENYDNLSAGVADQLANKALSVEDQRNELKKKYYERMKNGLDAVTALRFLQVENQIERLLDLQIASELPVVPSAK
jgi:hypothetical protein